MAAAAPAGLAAPARLAHARQVGEGSRGRAVSHVADGAWPAVNGRVRAGPAVNRPGGGGERRPRRLVRVGGAVDGRALGRGGAGGAAGGRRAALVGRHRLRRRPAPHRRHLAARRAPGPPPGQGGCPAAGPQGGRSTAVARRGAQGGVPRAGCRVGLVAVGRWLGGERCFAVKVGEPLTNRRYRAAAAGSAFARGLPVSLQRPGRRA